MTMNVIIIVKVLIRITIVKTCNGTLTVTDVNVSTRLTKYRKFCHQYTTHHKTAVLASQEAIT